MKHPKKSTNTPIRDITVFPAHPYLSLCLVTTPSEGEAGGRETGGGIRLHSPPHGLVFMVLKI